MERLNSGNVKRRSAVGNVEKMNWDKQGLKDEIESCQDGTDVNWSEIARRYQIRNSRGELARNGGQIAKEWLISEGIDLSRLAKGKQDDTQAPRKRRRLKRGVGGEISIPVQETNEKLKAELKTKIDSCEYDMGELVAPRKVGLINAIEYAGLTSMMHYTTVVPECYNLPQIYTSFLFVISQ